MQSGTVGWWDWSLLAIVYAQDPRVLWISLREGEKKGKRGGR